MAGRKNKYTVDYFPHYCSGESKTMFILENKFGLVGYAIWYKTLELLGKSEYHFLDLRDDTNLLFIISKLGITEEKFIEIYDLLAKLDAIDMDLWNNKIVFSDNFVCNVEDAYVRRKGIDVLHKLQICEHLSIKCIQKLPKESKVKKTKEDNSKIFIPPTEQEFRKEAYDKILQSYGKDAFNQKIKGNIIAKYHAWNNNDWKDGYNKPIKNWKAKLNHSLKHFLE